MGPDFWTYGVADNTADLEAFCRYCHAQRFPRAAPRHKRDFPPRRYGQRRRRFKRAVQKPDGGLPRYKP